MDFQDIFTHFLGGEIHPYNLFGAFAKRRYILQNKMKWLSKCQDKVKWFYNANAQADQGIHCPHMPSKIPFLTVRHSSGVASDIRVSFARVQLV